MRHNCISTLAVFMGLALCGVPSSAEELAPVKDLPHTIGSAAKTHGPLMFCNVSDASSVARAYGAAAKRGKQPFVIGWKLGPTPPYAPPEDRTGNESASVQQPPEERLPSRAAFTIGRRGRDAVGRALCGRR